MEETLYMTKEVMEYAKSPFGKLMKGDYGRRLRRMMREDSPEKLICVGDFTSDRVQQYGVMPDIIVVDGKTKREHYKHVKFNASRVYDIKNEAGTLSPEARRAMAEALKHKDSARINVEGEEDLITLLAVKEAPLGSAVMYGQPNEGVVFVKVTQEKKDQVDSILEKMRKVK
jgi:GTP-dependent dephospho-CoA kinase